MPQFQTNVETHNLVEMTFTHTCPECGEKHEIEDWTTTQEWVCECEKRYYTDATGQVWERDVPVPFSWEEEVEENGEPDAPD